MKKKYTILMLAVFVLCACSEDIVERLFHDDTEIEISTSFEEMKVPFTRAIDYDAINKAGFTVSSKQKLREVIVNLNDGDHDYNGNIVYTIQGEEGQVSDIIASDKKQYFYENKTAVDVWGRYPNTDNVTTEDNRTYFTVKPDQSDADDYQASDLMLTQKVECTRSKQGDGTYKVKEARLNFEHQMAKIVITAFTVPSKYANPTITDMKVKDIKLMSIKPKVEITPSFDTDNNPLIGEADGAPTDILLFQSEEGVKSASGAALFPPQTFTHTSGDKLDFVIVTVSYKEDNQEKEEKCEYYFKDGGKTFKGGTTYVMNLEISDKDVRLKDEYNVEGVPLTQWQNDELRADISAAAEFVLLTTGENGMNVVVTDKTRIYTGNEIQLTATGDDPEIKVVSNDESVGTLMYGRDYRLLYVNNIDAGTATVIVEGSGIYIGTLDAIYTISQKSIADESITVDFSKTTQTYNTREHKPTPTVTDSEPTDTRRQTLLAYDYEITYDNTTNTNAGTGKVTLTGKGNYTGSREATFTIGKAEGSVKYNEKNLSLVMPEGHPFEYITSFEVNGDGEPTSIESKNTNAIDDISILSFDKTKKTGEIKFRVKAAVTDAKIVMTLSGKNYDYSDQNKNTTNVITIEQGPKLPIEYVGQYDIHTYTEDGSAFSFATTHSSRQVCHLAWVIHETNSYGHAEQGATNQAIRKLTLSGLKDSKGNHYHMPSTWEWRSIFPGSSYIFFGRSYQNVMDTGVGFGVDVINKTTDSDDAGYEYGMPHSKTTSWQSDFYSPEQYQMKYGSFYPNASATYTNCTDKTASLETKKTNSPNMTCYALRFKGTTYCSAWRYDWYWADTDYEPFTGNEAGWKSMVVRVLYLGPTFEYKDPANWKSELENLNWEYSETDTKDKAIIRRFPCCGALNYHNWTAEDTNDPSNASNGINTYGDTRPYDRIEMNWYYSCTAWQQGETLSHYSVRLTYPFMQGDQSHINSSLPIRLFMDRTPK